MAHFLATADPDLVILENGLLGVDYARMAIETAPNNGRKMAILNLGSAKGMPDTSKYPRPVITLPPGFSYEAPNPLPELTADCRPDPDTPLVCFTTSGTTGPSKLATHTQRAVLRSAVDISWAWEMRPAKGSLLEGKQKFGKVLEWGGKREVMELDVGAPTFENRCRDVTLVCIPYCGAFAFHIVFSMLLGAGGTVLILDGYNPDIAAHYFHNYNPLPFPDTPWHLRGATHICVPDAVHGDMLNRAHLYGKVPSKPGEVVPLEQRPYRRWRFALTSNFANTAKQIIKQQQEICPHAYTIQGYGSSGGFFCGERALLW